jgi:hypothetical protein
MTQFRDAAEINGWGAAGAHPEDSLALAEHLVPADLYARIQTLHARPGKPKTLLTRAGMYNEYALATPGYKGDDALFLLGRQDLLQVVQNERLGLRHPLRVNAEMLLAYEEAFRTRAHQEPITDPICVGLQAQLSDLMLRYMDGSDLTPTQLGQLSELVAATYLLNTELFPYMALYREECNIVSADNHDFYTIHPTRNNRIKKAPASIKFRESHPPGLVVTLSIGRLARLAASMSPVYEEKSMNEAQALRLAADVMICHNIGDTLSMEDDAFMYGLTELLHRPLRDYALQTDIPDYASNAEALQREMAARGL